MQKRAESTNSSSYNGNYMNRTPILSLKELPNDTTFEAFDGTEDQAAEKFKQRFGRYPDIQYLYRGFVLSPLRPEEAKSRVAVPLRPTR